jgi:hypothetical protein
LVKTCAWYNFIEGLSALNMNKELIYKKTYDLIEQRKTLWATLIVLNGGLAGLLASIAHFSLTPNLIIKILLIFIGAFFDYFFLICISDTAKDLKTLYNKLESESE